MIGTEFLKGQGLGNQLLCYVSARSIAIDKQCEFGTAGWEHFANNIHSQKGMYFMDVDLGQCIQDVSKFHKYYEKEQRIYLRTSAHDRKNGCYIAGMDTGLREIEDNTLLYGNLQAEEYFIHHREEIRQWLKVKKEYDSYDLTDDKICILNMRGGEYVTHKELFLEKDYWVYAMEYMKSQIPDIQFIIITEDVAQAKKIFPELECYHRDIAGDYVAVKNARYLIVSNSSFAILPVFTSETLRMIIAPKYWARYNVSDGYWASKQNIYSFMLYMDRNGRIFTPDTCKKEVKEYERVHNMEKLGSKGRKSRLSCELYFCHKWDSLKRRVMKGYK